MGERAADDVTQIPAIEAEVEALRERTFTLASELERRLRATVAGTKETVARVRRALDVRAQLSAHPVAVVSIGLATTALLGTGVYYMVSRWRRSRRLWPRLQARAAAYRALLAEPGRALRPREPLGKRLVAAALIAGATAIARGLAELLVKRATRPRALPEDRDGYEGHEAGQLVDDGDGPRRLPAH